MRISYDAAEDLAAALDAELGRGGIFVHTDLNLAPGTELSMSVSCPTLAKPAELGGIVRWRGPARDEPDSNSTGLGIEFLEDQDVARAQLKAAVTLPRKSTTHLQNDAFRVLLAEDNAFVRELFRHALTKFQADLAGFDKYEILIARDGEEALRIMEGTHVDIAILDHYLPGLNGCSLLRRMRAKEHYRQTPILMISAGGDEVRDEATMSGATLFLQKPVLLTQLLDTLRGLLLNNEANAS